MRRTAAVLGVLSLAGCAGAAPAPFVPAPTPIPTLLIQLAGQGDKNSAPFNAPSQWTITWSYQCPKVEGLFWITLYDSQGVLDVPVTPPQAAQGGATDYVYKGGDQVHLEINAGDDCSWFLQGHS